MKRQFMRVLYRLAYLGHSAYLHLFRPVTIGVKIMLLRDESILLVRHTYRDGWFFPGGGVKRRETFLEAAHREAAEEVGATIHDVEFFCICSKADHHVGGHIVVFLSHNFTLSGKKDFEIADQRFFPLDALPPDLSIRDRRRLAEYGRGEAPGYRLW